MRSVLIGTLATGFMAIGALSARADIAFATNAAATGVGNGQTFAPFDLSSGSGYSRYQQVYTSALFGSFSNVETLTGFALRSKQPFLGSLIQGTITISNVIITASTTQKNDTVGLDANLNNNLGADATVVYSGPLTVTSATSGTAAFGSEIVFQNAFNYDKTAGNLLLQIVVPLGATESEPNGSRIAAYDTYTDAFPSADGISSASSTDPTQPVGSNSTTGLATEFFGTAGGTGRAPEPASLGVLGMGGLMLLRRKR